MKLRVESAARMRLGAMTTHDKVVSTASSGGIVAGHGEEVLCLWSRSSELIKGYRFSVIS